MSETDKNDLAFWFPPIRDVGLLVPQTAIVQTDVELFSLLDGKTPDGWAEFMREMFAAARPFADPVGPNESKPFFLRTGHTSGKHSWNRTCYVAPGEYLMLEHHVAALVEEAMLADMFGGLPVRTWVIRKLIPTVPICHCELYGGMPVNREFRVFIREDQVEHVQPYWPAEAVEQGRPDDEDWRERLAEISVLGDEDGEKIAFLAGMASAAVGGGYWSVDFLQDEDGVWWLTDMALGEQSFWYDPAARGR